MTGLISLRVLVAERRSRFFLANCISRLCFKRYCHCFMMYVLIVLVFLFLCIPVHFCLFSFQAYVSFCLYYLFCVSCLPSFGEMKIYIIFIKCPSSQFLMIRHSLLSCLIIIIIIAGSYRYSFSSIITSIINCHIMSKMFSRLCGTIVADSAQLMPTSPCWTQLVKQNTMGYVFIQPR